MASFNTMNSIVRSLTKDEDDSEKEDNYEVKSEPCIEIKIEEPRVFHSLRNFKNIEENNLNFSLKKEVSFFYANTKNSGSSGSKSMPYEGNSRSQKLKQF